MVNKGYRYPTFETEAYREFLRSLGYQDAEPGVYGKPL